MALRYLWSTGETTPSITVNPKSTTTYTVKITDESGAVASDVITITVGGDTPTPPTPTPTGDCNLMSYLPEYWHENLEMQEILKRQCEEYKIYVISQEPIFTDSFILQASESRIVEWEKMLGITPSGSLDERRQAVFSMLYSHRKLDEATIKELVKLNCSNADCNVQIKNSNIDIEVLPISYDGFYNFANLNRILRIKKPAHLGLCVHFYRCSWGDVNNNFNTWGDVKKYGNWVKVRDYLPYLEG